jgi:hypothetical protein
MTSPKFRPAKVVVVKPPAPSPHRPAAGANLPAGQKYDHDGRPLSPAAPESIATFPELEKSTPEKP